MPSKMAVSHVDDDIKHEVCESETILVTANFNFLFEAYKSFLDFG